MGKQFDKYRNEISGKNMKLRQEISSKTTNICKHPLYMGEFGMELRAMVPWAYHKSQNCRIYAKGLPGTKYMYYFSYNHTIKTGQRSIVNCHTEIHFEVKKVHLKDFPYDTEWLAPNFKDFLLGPTFLSY